MKIKITGLEGNNSKLQNRVTELESELAEVGLCLHLFNFAVLGKNSNFPHRSRSNTKS